MDVILSVYCGREQAMTTRQQSAGTAPRMGHASGAATAIVVALATVAPVSGIRSADREA